MGDLEIRDMRPSDEYFVGTCTHINESDEIDLCAEKRLAWLRDKHADGLRVKVAVFKGDPVGFLYAMPIEICPLGPLGHDFLAVPCLVAQTKAKGKGVGRALMNAAEEEARLQGKRGMVTTAYYHDFWFMPAAFFERVGFTPIARREVVNPGRKEYLGEEALLWKTVDSSAEPPRFLTPNFEFEPVPGKVVIDLLWNTFCQTSNIEAQRVREVADEMGDKVVLNEYCGDDREVLSRYQVPRGIFINGREIGWGHEAPKGEVKKAILEELQRA
jgi:GNAT superfamily N-acetyltransferase